MKRPINISEYTFRSLTDTVAEKYSSDIAYSSYRHPDRDISYRELK